jgi:beta-glucosidase
MNTPRFFCTTLLAVALATALIPSRPAFAEQPSVEDRINSLLSQMTLAEKFGQLQQVERGPSGGLKDADVQQLRQGLIGSSLSMIGAKHTNAAQKVAVEESRLKIPLLVGYDTIHGYKTIFPIPLAESCSWNPKLLEQAAEVAGRESYAVGIRWVFAPMVDIARDPRWGRISEGGGEDTYLVSRLAEARVRGFQGDDYSQTGRVAACAKHYVGYAMAEGGRDYNSVDVSERALRETYLPPFKACVDSGVASIMTSFNDVSGVPATANPLTLKQILRKEWGFDGLVVSDYTAVEELIKHGTAANGSEAAASALKAGCDMEMVSKNYNQYGAELIKQGKLDLADLDQAVKNVLRLKFRLGLFEHPYTDESLESKVTLTPASRQLARQLARESMVLLKNNQVLPFKAEVNSIALIGPLANAPVDQMGTWKGEGDPKDVVTVLAGIQAAFPKAKLSQVKGTSVNGKGTDQIEQAKQAAASSDCVVVVVGETADMSGEASSRSIIDLPGRQLDLIKAVHATGKPYVVVLMSGRPICAPWVYKNSPAILQAWHPGTEGGPALVDLLWGKESPSGRLTVSIPQNQGQIPVYYNHKNGGRPFLQGEKYTSHYSDVSNDPQYGFGYGLSYSKFELANLQIRPQAPTTGNNFLVSAEISNRGSVKAKEVVQLYIRDLVGSTSRPVAELRGFEKVELAPGETKTVNFRLGAPELGLLNRDLKFQVEPGDFEVWASIGSSKQQVKGRITI